MILRSPPPWPLVVMAVLGLMLMSLLRVVDGSPCSALCSCLGSFVDCSYRGLTRIPEDLPVWTEVLHLQHNFITNITHESLRNLAGLEELDMGNNLIINAKEFMAELPLNIRKLKLNNNKILEFELTTHLTRLVQLNLKSNNIYQIRHLDLASSLDSLDLSDNQLKNLISSVENSTLWPSSLTKLRLNHNRIAVIGKETFKALSSLQTLDLSANAIVEVEGLAFHGLGNLTVLGLEANAIRTLNDGSFWGLAGLKRLTLQNNEIAAVRKGWLYGLDTLETLDLTHNKVEKIEDGCWEFTKYLLNLDLSANLLPVISRGTFAQAGNLATLDLSRNQIVHVADEAFKQLRRLQSLDLSENQIGYVLESTTSVFSWLKGLQRLRLHRIGAVMLSGNAFGSLKQLRELDLSSNDITMVEPDAFRDLTLLQKLTLNSTSLICDCEIAGFLHLVQTKSYPDAYFRCAFPLELKGRHFQSLTPSQLKCFDKPRPKIERDPESMIVVVGSNITLTCAVAYPLDSSVSIRWKKDETPIAGPEAKITTSVRGNLTVAVSNLVLVDVDRSYSGSYQCIAGNNFGSVFSTKARIAVHVFPTFVKHPQNVTVRIGSTARLECSATGNPRPQVRWKKNGGPDFPAARQRRIRYETGSDVMEIVNATREDAGVYACIANNAAGAAVANATVIVIEASPGSIVNDPFTKSLNAGETAMFECPQQTRWKLVRWLKNGAVLLPTNRHFVLSDGQLLVISELTVLDSGLYQCESSTSGDLGSVYTLRVARKSRGWWDFDDNSQWIWIIIVVTISCIMATSCVWIMCIYYTRRKIRSGGSSTGTDETILPDECNPINGLHPSDSSLDSPMADYNEYLAVGSEYSVDGELYSAADCERSRSYSHNKPHHESFSSESPSFANYLTLKATRTNKAYVPSPHRSCNTLPRVLR